MSRDIKSLIKNRGSIKKKLTILDKFVTSIKKKSITPDLTNIQLRLDNNISLINEFNDVQLLIEQDCPDDDLENQVEEREPFETKFYEAISFLQQYLSNISTSNINSTPVAAHDPLQNYLLPKIKLPVFNGEYEQWLNFKKNFTATIDSNTNLTDGQKYNFLKAALEGYARRVIEGCDETQNYQEAWKMLCDKFNKKKFLVDTHIKAIFNINSITKVSFTQFRYMIDEISKHLCSLNGMKLGKEVLWDMSIIQVIFNKLDKTTQNKWKEHNSGSELPTLDNFLEFLRERADILESMEDSHSKQEFTMNKPIKNVHRSHINLAVNTIKCNLCKRDHTIYNCSEFLKLSINERWEKVKFLKLCINCLRIGHVKENCHLGPCKKCRQRHNTLLHSDNTHPLEGSKKVSNNAKTNLQKNVEVVNSQSLEGQSSSSMLCGVSVKPCPSSVLLSTVTFYVKDVKGNFQLCRGLLDCGAQSNLITEDFCKVLNCKTTPTKLSIIGINQVTSTLNTKTSLSIFSKFNDFHINLSCYVVPSISTIIPPEKFNTSNIQLPDNIELSDPEFNSPNQIQMLIGASIFWELLSVGKIKLNSNGLNLQNTKLGWIVTGVVPSCMKTSICNFSKTVIPEDEQLKRFWEINEISDSSVLSKEDLDCEKLFNENTIRKTDGRFVVKLPLKTLPQELGESKMTAIKRFHSLEKKFKLNQDFYKLYKEFIDEYIALGHMTKVENPIYNIPHFYFPHHGIIKDSITTRLRVVFDGSCKSSSGLSLNDIQFTGPKLQNNLFDILLRFRYYTYVVSADITKMYRQIDMHEDHKPLQLILWRYSPTEILSTYQLNTVTYGTKAAPYLAIKCIQRLAEINLDSYPDASKCILNDFYVDDMLTGSNDLSQAQVRCKNVDTILKSGNFILRKWHTNNIKALAKVDPTDIPHEVLSLGDAESSKTLGIQWISKTDKLKYKINSFPINNSITKRQILSTIAQIYDPLGLLGPVIIISKILIQKLWSIKLLWDEPIPESLYIMWEQFYNKLNKLNKLTISRHVIGTNCKLFDIHCFCDASTSAYATCIYFRSINSDENYYVHLLCSKTKVSPLKILTVPRLELCAALLGAQLIQQLLIALPDASNVPIHFWSDSQIVLCWLRKAPDQLQMFVANRISKIQTITNVNNWHYVNTKYNPADLASRGVLPENLEHCQLWWQGPDFLQHSIDELITTQNVINITVPEMKKSSHILINKHIEPCELFLKYSNLNKVKRIASYCFRFVHNATKDITERNFEPLSASELEFVFVKLLKLAQLESFREEISILKTSKFLPNNNRLSNLSPFLDENNLLRVGGRLQLSSGGTDVQHPILLCSRHSLTKLIFINYHEKLLHPGPQLLLASIRQRFWPIGGRNLARKIVKFCLVCFRVTPTFATSPMASLPIHRITPSMPFKHTGLDYAGPFLIKNKIGRGAVMIKCYICVFVCFSTKAIHLELVGNLTTECFLSCLRRFTSRRGLPSDVYSDNGKTFIGARNELHELVQFLNKSRSTLYKYYSENNINWHFIPPYSPNFGGLWEAAVKSTKSHLKKIMINKSFTFEEFYSLIVQIEGILNSRPLYSSSNDPNDLNPITPSHFLIGRPIIALPDTDFAETPTNRLPKFKELQQVYQQFWIRYTKEYVSQLHHKYKWRDPATPIDVGTLVLIRNDQQPPCKWPLGRIKCLHPGKDGISRVATLTTTSGTITRSIRHLCPIPMQE